MEMGSSLPLTLINAVLPGSFVLNIISLIFAPFFIFVRISTNLLFITFFSNPGNFFRL